MAVITITKENFEAEVLKSAQPVLLDFWAAWCGPCRMLSPIVDEVAEERTDVKVGKVNVDEQPDLAAEFGVMSIPTLLLFENGKLVFQFFPGNPAQVFTDQDIMFQNSHRMFLLLSSMIMLPHLTTKKEPLHGKRCAAAPFLRFHHLKAGFREIISPFCTNAQKNRIIKIKARLLSCFTTLS